MGSGFQTWWWLDRMNGLKFSWRLALSLSHHTCSRSPCHSMLLCHGWQMLLCQSISLCRMFLFHSWQMTGRYRYSSCNQESYNAPPSLVLIGPLRPKLSQVYWSIEKSFSYGPELGAGHVTINAKFVLACQCCIHHLSYFFSKEPLYVGKDWHLAEWSSPK